ncbi:phytoene desaturase family protein [Nocardioides litoris]|uniref:phytoene desaturase family protein n=1 Tax=Nocardioides litoris TaxID=1926648 RepID=UPI00111F3DBE|nr:phytoene desaturase family protein [Nocardioides litoris]
MSSHVVVVGAGVGGLAAAARLAAAGHRVTVLEQAAEVGGKLGTLDVDGHLFDTGPSLLTLPHHLEDVFAATGAPLADVLPLERLAVACRYRFPDGTVLDLPGDVADVPDALDAALGPGRGAQWTAFLRRAERIWDITADPFLHSPIGVGDMVRLSRRLDHVAAVAPWRSLRSLGRAHLRDPRLLMLLDRYATYTGSDPRRAPAALATVPYAEQRWGSWYVPGGLHRIAEALRDRALALGAEVRLGTEVVSLVVSPAGAVTGVELGDGSVVAADAVVANADATQVYGRLLADTAPGRRRAVAQLRRTTPSLSGHVSLVAVDESAGAGSGDPLGDVPHHQVLFAEDYDEEFDAVFGRRGPHRPVARPTVYVSAPRDPALAPPGHGAWFVLVNAPRHDPSGRQGLDWDQGDLVSSYGDVVLDVLASRGLDVRGRVRHRVVRSPADLERLTLTPGGSIYGSSSNGATAAFLRPANRSPVPGLFLVGGSSHPGGGLPLVLLSARIVSDLVGPARA